MNEDSEDRKPQGSHVKNNINAIQLGERERTRKKEKGRERFSMMLNLKLNFGLLSNGRKLFTKGHVENHEPGS